MKIKMLKLWLICNKQSFLNSEVLFTLIDKYEQTNVWTMLKLQMDYLVANETL